VENSVLQTGACAAHVLFSGLNIYTSEGAWQRREDAWQPSLASAPEGKRAGEGRAKGGGMLAGIVARWRAIPAPLFPPPFASRPHALTYRIRPLQRSPQNASLCKIDKPPVLRYLPACTRSRHPQSLWRAPLCVRHRSPTLARGLSPTIARSRCRWQLVILNLPPFPSPPPSLSHNERCITSPAVRSFAHARSCAPWQRPVGR